MQEAAGSGAEAQGVGAGEIGASVPASEAAPKRTNGSGARCGTAPAPRSRRLGPTSVETRRPAPNVGLVRAFAGQIRCPARVAAPTGSELRDRNPPQARSSEREAGGPIRQVCCRCCDQCRNPPIPSTGLSRRTDFSCSGHPGGGSSAARTGEPALRRCAAQRRIRSRNRSIAVRHQPPDAVRLPALSQGRSPAAGRRGLPRQHSGSHMQQRVRCRHRECGRPVHRDDQVGAPLRTRVPPQLPGRQAVADWGAPRTVPPLAASPRDGVQRRPHWSTCPATEAIRCSPTSIPTSQGSPNRRPMRGRGRNTRVNFRYHARALRKSAEEYLAVELDPDRPEPARRAAAGSIIDTNVSGTALGFQLLAGVDYALGKHVSTVTVSG